MPDAKTRSHIAFLAARLMYDREESEYFTAKRKAARQLGVEYRYRPSSLPSNAEIREQIGALAQLHEGDTRSDNLRDMRLEALRIMRLLEVFRPRLIGSVLTGHIRTGSDIDLHLFSDHLSAVTSVLEDQQCQFTIERKRVVKQNQERIFVHIHIRDRFNFELKLYASDKYHYPFKSSITGKLIERATLNELEQLLGREYPELDLDSAVERLEDHADRFELFRLLLQPLERVKQNPAYHPEGYALYHSLQVFELARNQMPWDEEFLLAALLHDVGKAIAPSDHVAAGLAALEGTITERTKFLIAHHMDAARYEDGSLGHRAKKRLRESPDFDELMLLRELDNLGRQRGAQVCELHEALSFIRNLAEDR